MRTLNLALPIAVVASAVAAVPASASTISLRVSTHWAVAGFPVTATVTSSASGTVWLSQSRVDGLTSTKGGYCGHPGQEVLHDIASRTVTAGMPARVSINPSRLWFFGGDLFDNGSGCWDRATSFNQLVAVLDGAPESRTSTALQRVL